MISLSIILYGKPGWDLSIEGEDDIDPKIFKLQGDYLKEHLHKVTNITEKLQSSGWSCYGTLYTLEFSKDISETEAKKELKKLKINLKDINIEEYEEEEEKINN